MTSPKIGLQVINYNINPEDVNFPDFLCIVSGVFIFRLRCGLLLL
ncbi:hypothetical protein M2373_001826 [Chryseobacterium sp. JUb7]|nr:hypothetical protein [Chryseobacterium sp. JUb7]